MSILQNMSASSIRKVSLLAQAVNLLNAACPLKFTMCIWPLFAAYTCAGPPGDLQILNQQFPPKHVQLMLESTS
jgi:hypothetical protein